MILVTFGQIVGIAVIGGLCGLALGISLWFKYGK